MDHWGRGAARVLSFLCPAVYLWAGTGQAGTSKGVEGVARTDKDAGADAPPLTTAFCHLLEVGFTPGTRPWIPPGRVLVHCSATTQASAPSWGTGQAVGRVGTPQTSCSQWRGEGRIGPFRVGGRGPQSLCPPGEGMAPPYSKSRSHGPTPHTLSKTDHPRGPDQEKDRHLKKYSTRSKKTSYSLGLRGQSCLPSACHALVYTAGDRMGGGILPSSCLVPKRRE